jgi:hypothetical protein
MEAREDHQVVMVEAGQEAEGVMVAAVTPGSLIRVKQDTTVMELHISITHQKLISKPEGNLDPVAGMVMMALLT